MTATLVRVEDAKEPALDRYLRIRERDLVGRDGQFVAEGEVVVRVLAFESPFAIRSLLLEERRVDAMRDVVDRVPPEVPAYVVPQRVMDAVVGFHIHRGVLAVGDRGDAIHPETLLRDVGAAAVVVGLVGLANHDNVGGVFRNAAAFGARGVLVDAATCDPLYRKAVRVSVGGALVVPFARCESETVMLDVIERAGYEAIALTPRGEISIDELAPVDKRVLLLGTEGDGLPDHVLARARPVRIDMAKGKRIDSLNVAVASGIALHAVTRQPERSGSHARRIEPR
jgi:tRNA G18 (ribose-2'-O)-methylase SpoU